MRCGSHKNWDNALINAVIDDLMGYHEWITRERKIRTKLILQFHAEGDKHKIRVCANCREVVLCYESACPNCASTEISHEKICDPNIEKMIAGRIHCRDRSQQIFAKDR